MRKAIWFVLLAVLAVSLVVAAGCGGDEATTTTAGGTPTTAGGTDTTAGTTPTTAGTVTTAPSGAPVMGGVAKIGVMSAPARFGVPKNVIGPDQWFEGLFLEGMYNPTAEADVYTPALAESWELTPDKSAYIFHLRKGVKFHDGTDFNAAAAKFCWDMNITTGDAAAGGAPAGAPPAGATETTAAAGPPADAGAAAGPAGPPPGAGPPPDFSFVKSIEVVDDYTVKVNLKYWSNQELSFMGRKSWSVFSPTAYQQMGEEKMNTQPVGTGPFMLKSFTPNQEMVLAKNPNYWMKDASGQQLPYLDEIQIIVFQDPTTMVMAVQSGEIDGADHIPMPGAQQLSADSRFELTHFAGPMQMLTMNTTDAASIWSDLKMREALEYAIDKEGIAKSIGLGFMPAPYSIIHSISAVIDPGTTPRKYDPEKAKALIAEAGKAGAEVTLHFNATEVDPNLATAIQANLAAVGLKVNIDALPSASFAPISVKPPAGSDIIMNGLRGGSPNVLQGALEMYGKGTIYFPAAAWSEEFYKLADQAQQTATIAEGFPIVAQMEKLAYAELQVVPVMIVDFISVSGPTMKNMKWNFANLPGPWFQEIWVEK